MANRFSQTAISHPKPKLVDVVEVLLPEFYRQDELTLSGTENSIEAELINAHIAIANDFSSVIPNLASGSDYSAIYDFSTIAQFFVKQNNLTDVTPQKFEQEILFLDDQTFLNFDTSTQFRTYVEDTLIPKISANNPYLGFSAVDAPTDEQRADLVDTLISNLGWFYLLNVSSGDHYLPFYDYRASSVVADYLTDLFNSKTYETVDGLKALSTYLWNNHSDSFEGSGFIPTQYLSGTGTYASGTQKRDNLLTLVDTVYSKALRDRQDFDVRDAFDLYESSQLLQEQFKSKGPFYRLLKGFSWMFADMQNEADTIQYFYDIDDCPRDLLPSLAYLIGWRLYGIDESRWRLQLKNAVEIYKRSGTKQSIQLAVDSVLSQSVFDVSSNLYELWESYIPFLGMYALATESELFDSFSSLTRSKASDLGFDTYSSESMETNIRIAIDQILLKLVRRYPENFRTGGLRFDLDNEEYHYRGRVINIPPFEEIPYYANASLSPNLIDDFIDELVCLGVDNTFALNLRTYIYENSIQAKDDIRQGNTWLMFTSGVNEPPNWDDITCDPSNKDSKYIPLWSSKSSHYKIIFNASSFDFSKTSLEADSSEALFIASRIADDFSPAHAIKDLRLKIAETEEYDFSGQAHPFVKFDREENASEFHTSSTALRRILSLANTMPHPYYGMRAESQDPSSSIFTSGAVINVPRNIIRRRNTEYALGQFEHFSRDGFNSKLPYDMSPVELFDTANSGYNYVPLGWIPSSQSFHPIVDPLEPTGVWSQCENLGSSSVFFGVPTSGTFPCRGLSGVDTFSSYIYPNSSNLDKFFYLCWLVELERQYAIAEIEVESTSAYDSSAYFFDHPTSIANERINASGHPESYKDLFETELGRYLHQLYLTYIRKFNTHSLRHDNIKTYGPNIFRHTFGSIYWNSDLDLSGSQGSAICLALSSCSALNLAHPIFDDSSTDVSNFSTRTVTDSSALIVSSTALSSTSEYRNNTILSGIDFIFTRQTSLNNEIVAYNLQDLAVRNDFVQDKTFVSLRAEDGLPRIKFSLKEASENLFDDFAEDNFWLHDQDHQFKVTYTSLNNTGTRFGGIDLGIWIHTPYESGNFWYYAPDGKWRMDSSDNLTDNRVLGTYAHIVRNADEVRDLSKSDQDRAFKCVDLLNDPIAVINSLREVDFDTSEICVSFKKDIPIDPGYFSDFGHPLREGQDIVIEIFAVPQINNSDRFILIDNIDVYNKVLNNWSKVRLAGYQETGLRLRPYCKYKTYDLSPEELRIVLMKFREFGRGIPSRDSSLTANTMEVSGGSRLSDRWLSSMFDTAGTNLAGNLNGIEF